MGGRKSSGTRRGVEEISSEIKREVVVVAVNSILYQYTLYGM